MTVCYHGGKTNRPEDHIPENSLSDDVVNTPACGECGKNANGLFTTTPNLNGDLYHCVMCGHRWGDSE